MSKLERKICPASPLELKMTGAEISVVIPVRNEEKVIRRCLDALAENEFPSRRFEVIIVDNGSCDRTLQIVRTFGERLELKILVMEKGHISALRNRGAAEARGRVLAFLDADCLARSEERRVGKSVGCGGG